jgi:aminoglycoside phosphotransferase family enzyme
MCGDMYLGNIFVVNGKRFYLYNRIEFNDTLRYADVDQPTESGGMDYGIIYMGTGALLDMKE